MPGMEGPLVALQTAVHLSIDADAERFLAVWEDVLPVAAGRALHRVGPVAAAPDDAPIAVDHRADG